MHAPAIDLAPINTSLGDVEALQLHRDCPTYVHHWLCVLTIEHGLPEVLRTQHQTTADGECVPSVCAILKGDLVGGS